MDGGDDVTERREESPAREVGGHASTGTTIHELPPPPAWMLQPRPAAEDDQPR